MNASPTAQGAGRGPRRGLPLPVGGLVGFAAAIAAVLLIAYISFGSLDLRARTAEKV
ncbi:MAG: hypothetical protein JWQ88_1070, partial [Rhodoferax sp.]|nr:hypothetical protein [Rhodoferax sp.]